MAAALAAIAAWGQWSFELDTVFRTQILQQNVNSIVVLSDGKLLASGIMRFPSELSDKRLVRLLPDGIRDEAYNNSALGSGRLTMWQDMVYVNAGNIVRRILANGDNDASFRLGYMQIPYFSNLTGGDYHVFPDGRVLISGSHWLHDSIRGYEGLYELIWFTNTGYLDTTRVHRNANGPIYEFKELPNGQFICTCSCTQYEGQPVSRLFRVHADLTLDATFQPGVNWGNIYAYHGLPDGRVYVGGRYKRAAAPNDTLFLARFMPDGSLDPTFLPPIVRMGALNADYGPGISCLLPWSEQYVIAAGEFGLVNQQPRTSMFMVDVSGSLTTAFQDMQIGVYEGQFGNSAEITSINAVNSDTLYICGAYVGCNDGTTNDPQQRFVSRLLVLELPMGVAEEAAAPIAHYGVQPNPAHGMVVFTWDHEQHAGPARIVVRDLSGRAVATLPMNAGQGRQTWDASSMAPGTYVVEYIIDGQSLHTEKLVIQR